LRREKNLFGRYLKSLREEAGLSIGEVADKLSTSQEIVIEWENGASLPGDEFLEGLVCLYRISPREFREIIEIEKELRRNPKSGGPHD